MLDLQRADFEAANPVETGADGTAALAAIGIASKNTRLDVCFQIGRIIHRELRKKAFRGALGRVHEGAGHAIGKHQLWVSAAEGGKLRGQLATILLQEPLRARFASLRRIDAEPNTIHLDAAAPEGQELLQVIRLLKVLADDGAMNVDSTAGDVF